MNWQALEAAVKVQGKPVYFYTSDRNTIVHEFLSIYRVTASLPLSRDYILANLVLNPTASDPNLLYNQWLISHTLIEGVDVDIVDLDNLIRLMMESRLKSDGIIDSDILEEVLAKPHAYGLITTSKPLLATAAATGETWYFRSRTQFNDFINRAFGFKLSQTIMSKLLVKQDREGLFFGLKLEDVISYDQAKGKYPNLIAYHATSFNKSKWYTVLLNLDKPSNYRDWAAKSK